MKIGLATSGDFISNFLINEIYKKFPDDELFILIDENVGKVDTDFLKETIYYDHIFPEKYIYPLVENLNVKTNKYLTYNQLAKQKNINLFRFININKQEELLKSLNLDVIISMRFRTIFKDSTIAIPKYGVYNLHSGALPKYRGVCSLLYAILNGEKKFGCTIHKMINSIDAGPIFAKKCIPINKNNTYAENYIKMFYAILPDLLNLIINIKSKKKMILKKQDDNKSNYYSFPTENEIIEFKKIMKVKNNINIKNIEYILSKYI